MRDNFHLCQAASANGTSLVPGLGLPFCRFSVIHCDHFRYELLQELDPRLPGFCPLLYFDPNSSANPKMIRKKNFLLHAVRNQVLRMKSQCLTRTLRMYLILEATTANVVRETSDSLHLTRMHCWMQPEYTSE